MNPYILSGSFTFLLSYIVQNTLPREWLRLPTPIVDKLEKKLIKLILLSQVVLSSDDGALKANQVQTI